MKLKLLGSVGCLLLMCVTACAPGTKPADSQARDSQTADALAAGSAAAGGNVATTSAGSTSPGSAGNAVPAGSKGTIGVSVLTMTNPFFKTIGESIRAKAATAGYETLVLSGDNSVTTQQAQVKDFIVRRVAAIVLCPCDSRAIGPVIQEANAAGIPVFTADIACLAPEAQVVSHIATDNLEGGRQAALAMIEALGGNGGQIGVLDFKEVESCILRVKGFKEVLDRHNAEQPEQAIRIMAELPCAGRSDLGFKSTEDLMQAHPQTVGIFAINDLAALGARAALEKAGKADQVQIIGFDGQLEGKIAIRDGKIYADPIQFPDRIGELTAQSILDYFAGEDVPPVQLIPTAIYRQADAENDPELQGLGR
jgi:ribose transport system substrate-binding protein